MQDRKRRLSHVSRLGSACFLRAKGRKGGGGGAVRPADVEMKDGLGLGAYSRLKGGTGDRDWAGLANATAVWPNNLNLHWSFLSCLVWKRVSVCWCSRWRWR